MTVYVRVQDVEVRQVFTESMFQELQRARRRAGGDAAALGVGPALPQGGCAVPEKSRAGQEAAGVHAGPTHQHRAWSGRHAAVQNHRLPGRPLLHR